MSAGRRGTLISFETAATAQDEYGEETATWTEQGEEWAAIYWGRGDERRQAAAQSASETATFSVLDNPMTRAIRPKDRISYEGFWDIKFNVPGKESGERDIEATRAL